MNADDCMCYFFASGTFKRSYLIDRIKMNAESLSESDLANLRRRLAEARVTDVTEVNKNQLTYSNAKFKKIKNQMHLSLSCFVILFLLNRRMYMDFTRPSMSLIVISQETSPLLN